MSETETDRDRDLALVTPLHTGICASQNERNNSADIHHTYTVTPLYSGHPSDFSKVSTIWRCPLYRG